MTTENKETQPTPRTRTPRSYEDIERGVLALSLKERGDLVKSLKVSINNEATLKAKEAEEAKAIANGG